MQSIFTKVFLDQGILNKKYNLIIPILICFLLISVFKALLAMLRNFLMIKLAVLCKKI